VRAVFKLPEIAIDAIDILVYASCWLLVRHVDVVDCVPQAVCRCALSPALVLDHIIGAALSRMTDLKQVAISI
jgi:hypothetical protein